MRNCTTIDTSVTYVSAQTSVNVFRIDAIATSKGIAAAGPADRRPDQDAGAARVSARRRRVERIVAGDIGARPFGRDPLEHSARRLLGRDGAEALVARGEDLCKGRVAVLRHVHRVVR